MSVDLFVVIQFDKGVPFGDGLDTVRAPIDMEEINGGDGFEIVCIGNIGRVLILIDFDERRLISESGDGHKDEK